MTAFIAEMIGTLIVILLGNGVVANVVLSKTKGNGGGLIAITTGWALAVFAGVVIAAPYSGAHLNPAVSLALAVAGSFAWDQLPYYILAQFTGAMLGAFLVWVIYRDHYAATEDAGLKEGTFCTSPAIPNRLSNLLSEIIGAFVLLLVIFHFTGAEMGSVEQGKVPVGLGSLGALPVALLIWAIGLSLGGTTGYAINPARDLGPRIVHALLPIRGKSDSNWSYAWIPVLGPLVGATLAALLYLWLQHRGVL